MITPPKGIKKQIFGSVLICLGAVTSLLARAIGFELDNFYIAIVAIGAGLFVYGSAQNIRHKATCFSKESR